MATSIASVMSSPKFGARHTLALFLFANWIYQKIVVDPTDGLASFDHLPAVPFKDRMFFHSSFTQASALTLGIDSENSVKEHLESKTLLLNKQQLQILKNINEDGIKKMLEENSSADLFSILVGQKIGQNSIIETVIPTSYTSLDTAEDEDLSKTSILLPMVFSIETDTLDKISSVFDLDNTTAVSEVVDYLLTFDYLQCFKPTFELVKKFDIL